MPNPILPTAVSKLLLAKGLHSILKRSLQWERTSAYVTYPLSSLCCVAREKGASRQNKNHWCLLMRAKWKDAMGTFDRPRAHIIRCLLRYRNLPSAKTQDYMESKDVNFSLRIKGQCESSLHLIRLARKLTNNFLKPMYLIKDRINKSLHNQVMFSKCLSTLQALKWAIQVDYVLISKLHWVPRNIALPFPAKIHSATRPFQKHKLPSLSHLILLQYYEPALNIFFKWRVTAEYFNVKKNTVQTFETCISLTKSLTQ